MKTGIYIHIPYCVKKCDYCDFYSVSDVSKQSMYFKTLKQEMSAYLDKNISVDSVFIGGGTPSVADAKEVADLLDAVSKNFSLSSDTEITMELNPKTFDRDKLQIYREAGVNRISMGLQSANNDELQKLGRIHTAEEFLVSYHLLLEMGFQNLNVDIMYGLPDSGLKTLENTLKFLHKLNPNHISAYALTLGEDSILYQRGYRFLDDDGVYEQYKLVCDWLSDYRHYEISNFVKQGENPCRHNLKYWQRSPYLGFGAAAHSFCNEARWSNPPDISQYMKAIEQGKQPEDREKIFKEEARREALMLALRTDVGVSYDDLPQGFYENNQVLLEQYEKHGYLKKTEQGFSLTEDGFFVSNAIISSLLPEIN
ncbi:MAG: radical SAM family heme chaperone HemW [Clostridia bacterium]|nr:radical SAM family heme chaperone HemW [Clostridia bacterium]